jgi:hypothetical protein
MVYFRSFVVGIVAALATAAIWILATFVLPIALPMLVSWASGEGGGAGAYIGSDSILAAALVGFIAGFVWHLRRAGKARPNR